VTAPLRVLHVYSGNLYGGVESMLVTLAQTRDLIPKMEQNFALCFEGRLSEELKKFGIAAHFLGNVSISKIWTVWRARRKLNALLAAKMFDCVICHAFWPYVVFAPAIRKTDVKLLVWCHDRPADHWLERWARRTKPDLIIANSRYTADGATTLFPDVRTEVLYCPVVERVGFRSSHEREAFRTELSVKSGDVVILIAARLEEWKGHRILLESLATLKAHPNWQLWIAGGAQRPHEQTYLIELKALAASGGIETRVRFLGQRADIPQLMAGADIYCQPNVTPEPFGVSYIEALYAGLPVIASAEGGPLETITSTCGILVPPRDRVKLTQAMEELIKSSEMRRQLSAQAKSRAIEISAPRGVLSKLHTHLATLTRN